MQSTSGFTRLAIVLLVVFELAMGSAVFGAMKDLSKASRSVAENGVPPEVDDGLTSESISEPYSPLEVVRQATADSNRMYYEIRVAEREEAQQTVYVLIGCMFAIPLLCAFLFWTGRWVAAGFREAESG